MLAVAGILAALAVAPGHAEIAYVSDGGIWSSRADGSERQPLVAAAGGERLFDPAWSPDGTTLAYVGTAEGEGTRVMVRDAAGTRALSTPPGDASDTSPAWSPDGTSLAFVRYLAVGERVFTQIVTRSKTSSSSSSEGSPSAFTDTSRSPPPAPSSSPAPETFPAPRRARPRDRAHRQPGPARGAQVPGSRLKFRSVTGFWVPAVRWTACDAA